MPQACEGVYRKRATPGVFHNLRPLIPFHFQRCNEGLLRNIDLAEAPHLLLSRLLLLQQLALASDVAAITFRGDVLPERADRLARDHLAADGSLNGNFEQMARDEILELVHHGAAARIGAATID